MNASRKKLKEGRDDSRFIKEDPRSEQIGESRLVGMESATAIDSQAAVVTAAKLRNNAEEVVEVVLDRTLPAIRAERIYRRGSVKSRVSVASINFRFGNVLSG